MDIVNDATAKSGVALVIIGLGLSVAGLLATVYFSVELPQYSLADVIGIGMAAIGMLEIVSSGTWNRWMGAAKRRLGVSG